MKIRNGFVSNSSSSSFIVKIKDYDWDAKNPLNRSRIKTFLTKSEIKKLKRYGFRYTDIERASSLEESPLDVEELPSTRETTLGYRIMCNQDEVIEFLLKNDISFEASCHYGHESVFYDKGDDYMIHAENFGLYYATHRNGMKSEMNKIEKVFPYKKISKKEFLDAEQFYKKLKDNN